MGHAFIIEKRPKYTMGLLKTYCWFLICLTGLGTMPWSLMAQNNQNHPKIKARSFDQSRIKNYKNDQRFQYKEVKRPSRPSAWLQLKRWLWRNFWEPLNNPGKHPVRSKVYYVLVAAVLLYAILKLINADLSTLLSRKQKSTLTFTEVDDNIQQMDFARLLEEAKAKQNYRRAVQLMYLHSLKKLTNKALIDWQIDKTNHEYENELAGTALQAYFREITLRFEYICYGDFQVNLDLFTQTEPLFEQFDARISQHKTKVTRKR